jgi:hypothetical protein
MFPSKNENLSVCFILNYFIQQYNNGKKLAMAITKFLMGPKDFVRSPYPLQL